MKHSKEKKKKNCSYTGTGKWHLQRLNKWATFWKMLNVTLFLDLFDNNE